MRRFLVLMLVGVVTLALLVGLLSVLQPPRAPEPPAPEKPTVYRLTPQEWMYFTQGTGPPEESWVVLPQVRLGREAYAGPPPASRGFLPAEACRDCHHEIYESFIETAHYRTSAEPSRETIAGSFEPGGNRLSTRNPELSFEMVERDDGFYQLLHIGGGPDAEVIAERIDIVVGSGNHGQSYLYWKEGHLYQHHVSYYSDVDRWTNSPGRYRDGTADLARPIVPRCLECHATYFAADPRSLNRYDPDDFLLHVSCVRCHGSGSEHIDRHATGDDDPHADRIVNPADLTRDRLNELCALCHSAGASIQPAFTYRPGEPLDEYIELDLSGESPANDDPHSANQLARLMKSACYRESDQLSCVTCHDPHRHERGRTALFSQRCRQCHAPADCGEHANLGAAVSDRCVQCHMPSRHDTETVAEGPDGPIMPKLRDHFIAVWPDASAAVRALIRDSSDARPATDPEAPEVEVRP